jgi:hypothetical protein
MSWHQAAGISAFCAVGVSASAARCASRTGLGVAIPRGSVSSILLGSARMATISRCSGRPFGIRVPGRIGSTSSTKGAAALGVSPNGWFWRRHNLRVCCERTNTRLVWRSCRYLALGRADALQRAGSFGKAGVEDVDNEAWFICSAARVAQPDC